MSLLTIIQKAALRIGLDSPAVVVGSTDTKILQLLAYANEEGEELATGSSVGLSYDWQALQTEANFVATATESQGAITTIASGFKYIIGDTIWNRSTRLQAQGSLTPSEWQNYKAWSVNSPYPKYRVRNGLLRLLPVPTAGDTYYFEYQSANWCTTSGGTGQTAWAADSDVGVLDEDLITAGVIWRFKEGKNLDYSEDFRKYQTRVMNAIARDVERRPLNMGSTGGMTGIVVPIGAWNVA